MTSSHTLWRRLRNPPPLDAALALALAIYVQLAGSFPDGLAFRLLALPMALALIWRRRFPVPVFCIVLVSGLIVSTAAGSYVSGELFGTIVAAMMATYAVAVYGRYWLLSLGVILVGSALVLTVSHGGAPPIPGNALPFIVLVPIWLAGNAIRNRQARADAFQERAIRLEQEQEYATRTALIEERTRIVRELHDVVSHSVSVMVVQAGAARHLLQSSPENAAAALQAVETTGREAMAELRHLLGLLSQDDDAALAPQPGLDHVETLIRRVHDAGLPVEMQIRGKPRLLPPGIDLTAYRIVQEALTNALKYSGLARTDVIIDYGDTGLNIEVVDEGMDGAVEHDGTSGPGRGLVGMRERVALYGGTLAAGPRLPRGYAVRAWLPLEGAQP